MVALICFVLAVLALPFKSKSRLEGRPDRTRPMLQKCQKVLAMAPSTRDPPRTSQLAMTNSPAPECRRRLESPPSLAQRFRHCNLIAGLPAGHRADGEMKRRPVVLPDGIEQDAGVCDVPRASQTGLDPGQSPQVTLYGVPARRQRQAQLRRLTHLLEITSYTCLPS